METGIKYNHPDLNNSYEYEDQEMSRGFVLYNDEGWSAHIYFNETIGGKTHWVVYEEWTKSTRIE